MSAPPRVVINKFSLYTGMKSLARGVVWEVQHYQQLSRSRGHQMAYFSTGPRIRFLASFLDPAGAVWGKEGGDETGMYESD